MRKSFVVIAIVLVMLGSGCLFGPSIECELSSTLTQSDCDHAVEAARPRLPNDTAATKIVVRAGCPRDIHCLSRTNALLITVEITFAGSDRLGVIAVPRTNWEAGQLRYVSAPTIP
jgi:hypothetical protein